MNGSIFVDTSAWYAAVDASDSAHALAARRLRRLVAERRRLVTTNHVVSESYTLLRTRLGSVEAQRFLRRARDSSYVQRTFIPESWEEAAEDLLAQYQDQNFSYVDATSFIAMRRLGLQAAFTFDHHFATAGFTLVSDDG